MGIFFEDLKVTGNKIVLESQESIVIEQNSSKFIKRRHRVTREKYPGVGSILHCEHHKAAHRDIPPRNTHNCCKIKEGTTSSKVLCDHPNREDSHLKSREFGKSSCPTFRKRKGGTTSSKVACDHPDREESQLKSREFRKKSHPSKYTNIGEEGSRRCSKVLLKAGTNSLGLENKATKLYQRKIKDTSRHLLKLQQAFNREINKLKMATAEDRGALGDHSSVSKIHKGNEMNKEPVVNCCHGCSYHDEWNGRWLCAKCTHCKSRCNVKYGRHGTDLNTEEFYCRKPDRNPTRSSAMDHSPVMSKKVKSNFNNAPTSPRKGNDDLNTEEFYCRKPDRTPTRSVSKKVKSNFNNPPTSPRKGNDDLNTEEFYCRKSDRTATRSVSKKVKTNFNNPPTSPRKGNDDLNTEEFYCRKSDRTATRSSFKSHSPVVSKKVKSNFNHPTSAREESDEAVLLSGKRECEEKKCTHHERTKYRDIGITQQRHNSEKRDKEKSEVCGRRRRNKLMESLESVAKLIQLLDDETGKLDNNKEVGESSNHCKEQPSLTGTYQVKSRQQVYEITLRKHEPRLVTSCTESSHQVYGRDHETRPCGFNSVECNTAEPVNEPQYTLETLHMLKQMKITEYKPRKPKTKNNDNEQNNEQTKDDVQKSLRSNAMQEKVQNYKEYITKYQMQNKDREETTTAQYSDRTYTKDVEHTHGPAATGQQMNKSLSYKYENGVVNVIQKCSPDGIFLSYKSSSEHEPYSHKARKQNNAEHLEKIYERRDPTKYQAKTSSRSEPPLKQEETRSKTSSASYEQLKLAMYQEFGFKTDKSPSKTADCHRPDEIDSDDQEKIEEERKPNTYSEHLEQIHELRAPTKYQVSGKQKTSSRTEPPLKQEEAISKISSAYYEEFKLAMHREFGFGTVKNSDKTAHCPRPDDRKKIEKERRHNSNSEHLEKIYESRDPTKYQTAGELKTSSRSEPPLKQQESISKTSSASYEEFKLGMDQEFLFETDKSPSKTADCHRPDEIDSDDGDKIEESLSYKYEKAGCSSKHEPYSHKEKKPNTYEENLEKIYETTNYQAAGKLKTSSHSEAPLKQQESTSKTSSASYEEFKLAMDREYGIETHKSPSKTEDQHKTEVKEGQSFPIFGVKSETIPRDQSSQTLPVEYTLESDQSKFKMESTLDKTASTISSTLAALKGLNDLLTSFHTGTLEDDELKELAQALRRQINNCQCSKTNGVHSRLSGDKSTYTKPEKQTAATQYSVEGDTTGLPHMQPSTSNVGKQEEIRAAINDQIHKQNATETLLHEMGLVSSQKLIDSNLRESLSNFSARQPKEETQQQSDNAISQEYLDKKPAQHLCYEPQAEAIEEQYCPAEAKYQEYQKCQENKYDLAPSPSKVYKDHNETVYPQSQNEAHYGVKQNPVGEIIENRHDLAPSPSKVYKDHNAHVYQQSQNESHYNKYYGVKENSAKEIFENKYDLAPSHHNETVYPQSQNEAHYYEYYGVKQNPVEEIVENRHDLTESPSKVYKDLNETVYPQSPKESHYEEYYGDNKQPIEKMFGGETTCYHKPESTNLQNTPSAKSSKVACTEPALIPCRSPRDPSPSTSLMPLKGILKPCLPTICQGYEVLKNTSSLLSVGPEEELTHAHRGSSVMSYISDQDKITQHTEEYFSTATIKYEPAIRTPPPSTYSNPENRPSESTIRSNHRPLGQLNTSSTRVRLPAFAHCPCMMGTYLNMMKILYKGKEGGKLTFNKRAFV